MAVRTVRLRLTISVAIFLVLTMPILAGESRGSSNNLPPTNVDFTFNPSDPDTGTIVQLNGTAIDPEGDRMTYSWDFGDGQTAVGQDVTHQFMTGPGNYSVTLSVDDGKNGLGTRPVNTTKVIPVTNNTPPTCVVPYLSRALWNWLTNFTITSYDPDLRDSHRYTWIWGDGTTDVTTTTWAWHRYRVIHTYLLTVWADDMTNLPGHNVSGWGYVSIMSNNNPPIITAFTVSTNDAQMGQWINFTGSAIDHDSDLLYYTFEFGDGNSATLTGWGNPITPLNLSVNHAYGAQGNYTAYLNVTDGYSMPIVASPQNVNISQGNLAPVVSPLTVLSATTVFNNTFHVAASDPDGDLLKYTWDFGDDSPLAVGETVSHAYASSGNYTFSVSVDDGTGFVGHNVTVSAVARIVQDFSLSLVAGWNLVTVPPIGFGYNASTLGLKDGDMISGLNPATGTYDQNYIVNHSPTIMDFAIAPSTGYWIFASANETLHLFGMYSTVPLSRALNFSHGSGWAIVGLNSVKTTWKASMIPPMYTNSAISVVASYVTANYSPAYYKAYIKGISMTDFYLIPGGAYFIYCSMNGTLTYTP